jgi:hypothetical protein
MPLNAEPTYVYGKAAPKPLTDLPAGCRHRLVLRAKKFAVLFIRTETAIRKHLVQIKDGKWAPAHILRVRGRGILRFHPSFHPSI